MPNGVLRWGLIIVCTLGLSGCAFTSERVSIDYTGTGIAAKVDRAESTKIDVQTKDARADRKIGSKKNGYGMETAPIDASNDIAVTVEKAIETELAKRGFIIASGGPTVDVEIVRFYNDFKIGFWAGDSVADITLGVNVKSPAGVLTYSHSVSAQGLNNSIQLATGENAKIALERALQEVVNSLVNDRAFIDAIFVASSGTAPVETVGKAAAEEPNAPSAKPPMSVDKSFLFVKPTAPPAMVGHQYYLCCNLIFDGGGETNDANYLLADDSDRIVLALGTPVTVTKAGATYVKFRAAQGGSEEYELGLEYGPPKITAEQYFPLILRESNPLDLLGGVAPDTMAAIRSGKLALGMDRAEAAMARGFPPFHQTAGLDAPTWLYYDDGDVGQYVTFSGDRISAIRTGDTP